MARLCAVRKENQKPLALLVDGYNLIMRKLDPGFDRAGSVDDLCICKLGRSIMGNNGTHYYPL